ncbi:MAG: SAM-dependent methyltransferase [Pseudohongiellaceae bacterium]|jgi:SAM-dependent methyltransferase
MSAGPADGQEPRSSAGAAVSSWELHGRALAHWWAGAHDTVVEVIDEVGEVDPVRVEVFFRPPEQLDEWELLALDACHGRVLDLGAGAGCHALALEARGLSVIALEVSADAVEVMTQRGVGDARCATAESWPAVAMASSWPAVSATELQSGSQEQPPSLEDGAVAESFDSMLMLMHGAGLAGDLDGFVALLAHVREVLVPFGALIIDSCDPGCGAAVAELHIAYQGEVGEPFDWLYLDAETLCDVARDAGFAAEVLWQDESGRHLCRLVC